MIGRRYHVPFIFALVVLLIGCGGQESAGTHGTANAWVSFNEGLARARKEQKPVVIDFYTSWCKWCKVMDERTFSKPEIAAYLGDHFVSIRINAESKTDRLDYEGKAYTPVELTRHFRVTGFPSLAYLDREGKLITVVPGFVPPETFLPLLKYINKECYKQQMTFDEFMKRRGECE
ncbi:MAG TPA: thioredoxin fold domain-containing protein [Patescibacteria group bacterium]|nr:thioredoxin fold domain-containing protein [Patescibacteria group bacterium]